MKLMNCPLNGPRNIDEFSYFGPVKTAPAFASASDAEWARYIFHAPNPVGVLQEWWCHAPTNFFFIAERDTATDRIIATYAPGSLVEPFADSGNRAGDRA